MITELSKRFIEIGDVENGLFSPMEMECNGIYHQFEGLGIWDKMKQNNRFVPAFRCANIAIKAATRLNELSQCAGLEPIVSPKVVFTVGLLFKSGQAIDEELISRFKLRDIDPHNLQLYNYPFYAPERTVDTSNSLKLALLLHQLGHPRFAKLVLHGPHPKFFEGAELPTVLASLANASLALNEEGLWHSYLHPAINLFAIGPQSVRTDEFASLGTKDWIDRSSAVAINTTLHHVLRIQASISFTDEEFEINDSELQRRWGIVQEVFKRFGCPIPENTKDQERQLEILRKWMETYHIEDRVKQKQAEGKYLLNDHCQMVAEKLSHLGREINKVAMRYTEAPVFLEEYLNCVGYCHDAIKAFDEKELQWLMDLKQYESELLTAYPPEVVAMGGVKLPVNDDTQLYVWLRAFEEGLNLEGKGKFPNLAQDFLIGAEHLRSAVATLLSFVDLTVESVKEDGKEKVIQYNPDITERFLRVVYERTSDPHAAIVGYAKLVTIAASLSWYLNIPLPRKGSTVLTDETLELIKSQTDFDRSTAIQSLVNVARVLDLFGVVIPKQLRDLRDAAKW